MVERERIFFVTGNSKKLEEVRLYLLENGLPNMAAQIEAISLDLPELQGSDCSEISAAKCRLAFQEVMKKISSKKDEPVVVLTEDTSLCYTALKGLPGPYVKWFLQSLGHQGLNDMLAAYEDKTAYAQTVFAVAEGLNNPDDVKVMTFVGRTKGRIVKARGAENFGGTIGWDPVFEPEEGDGLTYAEMKGEEKRKISHRSRSLEKVLAWLSSRDLRV